MPRTLAVALRDVPCEARLQEGFLTRSVSPQSVAGRLRNGAAPGSPWRPRVSRFSTTMEGRPCQKLGPPRISGDRVSRRSSLSRRQAMRRSPISGTRAIPSCLLQRSSSALRHADEIEGLQALALARAGRGGLAPGGLERDRRSSQRHHGRQETEAVVAAVCPRPGRPSPGRGSRCSDRHRDARAAHRHGAGVSERRRSRAVQ